MPPTWQFGTTIIKQLMLILENISARFPKDETVLAYSSLRLQNQVIPFGNVQTEPSSHLAVDQVCVHGDVESLPAGVLGLPPLLVVNYYFICKCLLANHYFIRRCLFLCSCAKMPFWLTPFVPSSVKDQGRCLRSGVHKEREFGFFPLPLLDGKNRYRQTWKG